MENNVQIVNHEIEDDVDVKRAGAEDAEAVSLKKHGLIAHSAGCDDCGIEPLEMADLQNACVLVGECDQLLRLVDSGSNGFFDQKIDTRCEERGRHLEMRRSRHADGCGIHGDLASSPGGEQGIGRLVDARPREGFLRFQVEGAQLVLIGIDDSRDADGVFLRLLSRG